MTFEMEGEPMEMVGEGIGTADGSRGRFDLTYRADGGQFRMEGILVGDEVWFRSRDFRRFMPNGKRWVHMVDDTMPVRTLTPSQFAKLLAESDGVREVSDAAQLDGRSVTHYAGKLEVGRVVDEVGGERFSVDMLEYGVPVDVQPPPAHEVIEESAFNELTEG
jgi:hypothetical protein